MNNVLESFSESAMSALSAVPIPTMSTELFSAALPGGQPNGLHNFIKEIRDSKNKEQERSRVDKELGNIRKKFSQSANLTSYQKKKYVWKMCYIYMLGYEVDFGYMEFISLLSSTKFQEKAVGYMAVALFLKPGDDLMTLVVNSIRNDIVGRVNFGQTLALSAVSNIGGTDLAEALSADVQKLLISSMDTSYRAHDLTPDPQIEGRARLSVVKKACLCLLRLYRTNPDCFTVEDWVDKLAKLVSDHHLGVVTAVMSLLLGLCQNPRNLILLEPLVHNVIKVLTYLAVSRTCSEGYIFYKVPSPWLQVKLLKFLQYFHMPQGKDKEDLIDALMHILTRTESSESVNKTNADYSVLCEAILLIINYNEDANERIRVPAFAFVGKFVSTDEANIRYIGLDLMNFILQHEGPEGVKIYKNNVIESLKDNDNSVKKRALENVFALTDDDNAHEVVEELLTILPSVDSTIKEDFVVKIAILTEKYYNNDLEWYIDTMIKMFLLAGDFVAEAIWHRIVLVVTNHAEIHEYAAEKLYTCIQAKFIPDILVCLAAYLLGEIGINICQKPEMSGYEQFVALHQHFHISTIKTQSVLLTTYVKFINLYPDTKDAILEIFTKYSTSLQLEIQQRACEYIQMPSINTEIMETVLNTMPMYSEEKENVLLSLNAIEKEKDKEKSTWTVNTSSGFADDEAAEEGVHSSSDSAAAADGGGDYRASTGYASPPSVTHKNTDDLLDMGDDDASAPLASPTPTSPAPYTTPMSPAYNPTAASTRTSLSSSFVTITPAEESTLKALFVKAVESNVNERAVLYENNTIKISIAYEYRSFKGRLQLILYNKSSSTYTSIDANVTTTNEIQVKMQPLPTQMDSGEEVTVLLAADCYRPFKNSIDLSLAFSTNNGQISHQYTLRLPILISSFFEPVPSDKTTYMNRWKMLENEIQEIFPSSHTLDHDYLIHLREILFIKLKIGYASELDPTEKTITGSFSFQTGSATAEGNLISVGGMLRVEADTGGNRFRVTIRSKHMTVSEGIRDVLKYIL